MMGKTLKDRKDMEKPKGYKNTLNQEQAKRIARREKINEMFNKVVKDRF
jgi:hypothetical protein